MMLNAEPVIPSRNEVDPEFLTGGQVRVPLLNRVQLLVSGRSGKCRRASHSRRPDEELAPIHRRDECRGVVKG